MRKQSTLGVFALAFAGLLVLGGTQLSAQTATILGTVTDASGATVPDASIQVKNTGTGASRTVNTDDVGRYRIAELSIGNYDAIASKTGFQTVAHNNVTLNVGVELVVDFALPVGQQTQTVTVEGQVAAVETSSSAIGVNTDARQMRELPLNGRNFEQLILLAPGVASLSNFTTSGFQGRAAQYSIAGSRPTGQAILMDNESLQNFWNKGMGSVSGSSLGVDAIAEFQTLTNTYGADFGGNGSVINSASRSGTNSFHGSAYEFLRNDKLDAWDTLAKTPSTPGKPALRQNQYGGTVGGPIQKDKLFFFGNYEAIQRTAGSVKLPVVPNCTAANAFTGGNCTPNAGLPIATQNAIINVLKLYPAPDSAGGTSGVSTQVGNLVSKEHYGLGRVDYNLSNNDSIFFRSVTIKTDFTDAFGGGGFGGAGGGLQLWPEGDAQTAQFTTLQWRRILSPTMVNAARINFSRNATDAETINSTPALQVFFPGAGRQDGQVSFGGQLAGIGGATQLPFNETQNRWTEGDDITWTKGAQTIKFGGAISRLQTNTYMPFRVGSIWAFGGLAGLLNGSPNVITWAPLTIPAGLPAAGPTYANRDYRHTEIIPYFQDDWKVSQKLTLNLGVRYSWFTNPIDNHDQLYNIVNFATDTNFSKVPNVMAKNPNTWNFDPRIGLAYDPFSDHKTSIRVGFGMFHQLLLPSDYTPSYWNHPPWSSFQAGLQIPGSQSVTFPTVPNAALITPIPTSSPAFDYQSVVKTPYNMQYNITVQREVFGGTILSIGYVGSHGVSQLTQVELNKLAIGASGTTVNTANGNGGFNAGGSAVATYGRLNTKLGSFPGFVPTTTTRYNSLQINATRRFQNNFQAQISYTYGKCEDNGSYLGSFNSNVNAAYGNPYDQNYDKSVCNYDITNQLRVNGLWALPFKGNRIVSGWQLSGIVSATGGLPFTVLQGVDTLGWGNGVVNPRPNLVGTASTTGNPGRYFDPSAYLAAPVGTYGNSPRLGLRGSNFNNTDIAVTKDTNITESVKIQFRAEFFNLFNHVNWGLPIPGNGSANLYTGFTTNASANGLPTIAIPNTNARLAQNPNAGKILYVANQSRLIQFALKLTF